MAALERLGGETLFRLGDGASPRPRSSAPAASSPTKASRPSPTISPAASASRRASADGASERESARVIVNAGGWLDFQDYFAAALRARRARDRLRRRRRCRPARRRPRPPPRSRAQARRDLPLEPVHQHRPDPVAAEDAHGVARLPGAGRRRSLGIIEAAGKVGGPDREDDGRAGLRRVDAAAVAWYHGDPIDVYVADDEDADAVAGLDMPVVLTRTLMTTPRSARSTWRRARRAGTDPR